VVDGLKRRIGNTLGKREVESRRRCRDSEVPSIGRLRGKEQIQTSSSSDAADLQCSDHSRGREEE